MEIIKHFTATTYVVYKNKVLLHFHKKLNMWLPVGGHIEKNELPEAAALREIEEETGLVASLYNPDEQKGFSDVRQLFRPMHILLEDIEEFHKHIDFIYYAFSKTSNLNPQDGETTDLRWLTADEIRQLDAAENVKALSLEAIDLLSSAN